MKTGICKFYSTEKGYGFIKIDDSNEDIFVHATGLNEEIRENDKVEFDVVEGKKGLNAVSVRLV